MTDFDTTNEGAPTEPLPIADNTAPTAPLPPVDAVPGVSAPAEHRPWRPSTGGIVALALAGAFAVSAISFGAGWGAHGLASHVFDRRGAMMSVQGHPGAFGNGYGQDSNGYGERGWSDSESGGGYGGRGMGPRGGWDERSAPDSAPGQNQQGFRQQAVPGVCPGQTW